MLWHDDRHPGKAVLWNFMQDECLTTKLSQPITAAEGKALVPDGWSVSGSRTPHCQLLAASDALLVCGGACDTPAPYPKALQ